MKDFKSFLKEEFDQEKAKRAGYRVDNPGGDWLKNKQTYADEDIKKSRKGTYQSKGLNGSSTAFVHVKVHPDLFKHIPGAMDEKPGPGNPKYDELHKSVSDNGYDHERNAILVHINHHGHPYVVEGNNRAKVARDTGQKYIHAEVHWRNGGENTDGPLTPKKVIDAHQENNDTNDIS